MRSVVRISEGLGNQLFQYAFGYSFARKTGQGIILDPFFWGTAIRSYQLDKFKIRYTKKFVSPILDYILGFGPRDARRFKEKYRNRKIRKGYRFIPERQAMKYDAAVYGIDEPSYFQGFWQTPRYFDEFYEEIKQQFRLKEEPGPKAQEYGREIAESNSVSLHIRRTDYERGENSVCLKESFYVEALNEMRKLTGDFKLFVFTDDKDFARDNFNLMEYILIEGLKDIEEFALMQRCKNHIIANSTFSWWGAYLAERKGGVVFAPVTDIWGKDFYPEGWHLIQTDVGE